MSNLVLTEHRSNVLVVTVNNPPVNALSPGVPEGIVAAIHEAAADPAVNAVVVIGGGRTFIAGADIREFGKITSGERPGIALSPLLLEIENCPKPVVMAIHGTALGGGLETAMAGHYRVAARAAQVGQPEVKLGLIPGAAGTQRLPRLAGTAKAMTMCAFGEPISATEAFDAGIVDQIIEDNLLEGAIAFAGNVDGVRRTRDLTEKLISAEKANELVEQYKAECARRMRGQIAPLAALETVAAASSMSFEKGCEHERERFEALLHGKQSKALIYAFFGERAVAKVPGLSPASELLTIRKAAVVGAGTMGSGIAMVYANAGIPVLLKDVSAEALNAGMSRIRNNYENSARKGKLSPEVMEQRLALIRPVQGYDDFPEADIVVEAVFESMALKKESFQELDDVMREGAILATNTSTLSIDDIAAVTRRPEWVIGHHFFSPANVMRLLEIVRGSETTDTVIASSIELARRLKKVGVLVGNCRGFVGNRMFGPYRSQAVMLVEEGATPQQVDRALYDWGMAMGPLAVGDLAGLDVGWRIRKEYKHLEMEGVRYPEAEDLLCEKGRLGQKTGAGWYKYDEKRNPHPDPEVEEMIRRLAAERRIPQRYHNNDEIVKRTVYALINEGARILEEGIALRSVDIDMIYVNGYGFPAWRGGPMHYADGLGLEGILEQLQRFEQEYGHFWQPAPLLERLAKENKRFADYTHG